MDEDWDDEQLAALDAAEAAVSSSSSSSRNDNDIASPQDIRDALQRAQSALATMRARNHAGASGRWSHIKYIRESEKTRVAHAREGEI